MPNIHAWQSCIDVKPLSPEARDGLVDELNWLEAHSNEFNEMVYRLRQKQKALNVAKVAAEPLHGSEAIINWLAESFHKQQADEN